jgi:SAM-dependent methyltransferase
MDDVQQIDAEEIIGEIREQNRTHQQGLSRSDAASPLSEAAMDADLASLQSSYDIYHIHFTSHRKGVGRLIVLAKQVLRKLLTPILEQQVAYNTANTRVVMANTRIVRFLYNQLEDLRSRQLEDLRHEQLEGLRQQQATMEALRDTMVEQIGRLGQQQEEALQKLREQVVEQIGGLGQQQTMSLQSLRKTLFGDLERRANDIHTDIASKEGRMIELEKASLQLKATLNLQERRLGLLLEEARKRLPNPLDQEQLQLFAAEERHALDALYVSFEDQFRGSREDIKERLRVYLPILEQAKLGTDEMPVLDVGCGRGEWLALLKEQGMRAQGVDLNRILVEECRQQGLEVGNGDALAYLRSLPDSSLGAVTGFHFIEHLPFDGLIKLLDETVRVLKPGGVAIFETPNPENVLVGSYRFYLDPTHRNPLPSPIVKFIAEARGLCRVAVMPLHPSEVPRVDEAGLDLAKRFNDYFYGPQDYAVIGWKV